MKKFTQILLSTVFITSFDKLAAVTLDPTDSDEVDNTNYSGTVVINDTAGNGSGGAIIFTGNSTATVEIQKGKVKVGNAAASGAKTSAGKTVVDAESILEITEANVGAVLGDAEVMSGGIISVDPDVIVPRETTSYFFLADRVYNLHTGLEENTSDYYTYPSFSALNCPKATGLPNGATINLDGAVDLSTAETDSSTIGYTVEDDGIHAQQADEVTSYPAGLSSAGLSTEGFPAGITFEANGNAILPTSDYPSGVTGYTAENNGIHAQQADVVTSYPSGWSYSSGDIVFGASLPGEGTFNSDGTINESSFIPSGSTTSYTVEENGIHAQQADVVTSYPAGLSSSGLSKTGFPAGITFEENGNAILPTSGFSDPVAGYTAEDTGIHEHQVDVVTNYPSGWSYDSGNIAFGGSLPDGGSFNSDGTVNYPDGYSAGDGGIHQAIPDVVTTPDGFNFSTDGVTCKLDEIAVDALPSGSTIDTITGNVSLPDGYSFDGSNFYNNGVKAGELPSAGFDNNNTGHYVRSSDSATFEIGSSDIQDVIVRKLVVHQNASIDLKPGAKWKRNINVIS
ncbi:MAG: hypothetical protein ACK4V2_06745 [Pseudomonadota bacterium]|jgi:hypothetical protein|nr:hypothetical protein [Alphaproteobacteria bacterium]